MVGMLNALYGSNSQLWHVGPLYRLHKGSHSTNLTKSPILTVSLQSASQRESFSD